MLTQETLKELLSYDPATGIFRWKVSSNHVKIGSIAGALHNKGYIAIKVKRENYLAHRLVWLYMYGYIPTQHIDHIDHDRSNNSLSNLREVPIQINCQNLSMYSSNTSGVMGVKWHKRDKVWEAQITVNKKRLHLGRSKDMTKAIELRKEAEVLYMFHENHGAA
jgi:hypothetical protein